MKCGMRQGSRKKCVCGIGVGSIGGMVFPSELDLSSVATGKRPVWILDVLVVSKFLEKLFCLDRTGLVFFQWTRRMGGRGYFWQ